MPILDLLKSVSKSWPVSLDLALSDDGFFVRSETSDDSSRAGIGVIPATQTPSSGHAIFSTTWRPGLPLQYPLSPTEGYESDNEDNGRDSPVDKKPTYRMPGAFEVTDEPDWDWQTPDEGSSNDAIVENDNLESHLATQNPWRTLARFRSPFKQEDLCLYSRFPILSMPAELLVVVAEFLPTESVACLALACKATYLALGTRSFKMPKPDLWKFLLLIEHERQNSYACCRCLTLHRPPGSFSRHRYRCCNSWRRRFLNISLPDSISPGLVKMIGRKYFEDSRICQEYLSWAMMSTKKTTRYIKLATHVIPRMLDGSLLLRTETYIHPFHDGHLTERSLIELTSRTDRHSRFWTTLQGSSLCDHQDWISHLPNLKALKESIEPTKCVQDSPHYHRKRCYSNERIMRKTDQGPDLPMEMCDLIHEQPCKTWKLEVPAIKASGLTGRQPRKACRPKLEDTYDGEIKGCRECATDFCISAREVPGVGHCLVLSTWKDLGGVGPGEAEKWDSHVVTHRSLFDPEVDDFRSEDQVGQAYKAFEKVTGSGPGETQRYHPQLDRKMIRDLTRRVHKYRHKMDETTDTDANTAIEEEDDDDEDSW